MSIELGFAPCTIADMQVGIVDVPGHENFIKTMVAGASGMDGVILVVAADDGVMPQTREHLDILTLLGIRHGMVALTKIDRVDAEHRGRWPGPMWRSFCAGTFLEDAPILPALERHRRRFRRLLRSPVGAMVRGIRAEADRRRVPPAAGAGVLRPGLRHRRGRHPRRRLGARWATKWCCCRTASSGRIRRIEVYGRHERHGDGRPVRGDQRAATGTIARSAAATR